MPEEPLPPGVHVALATPLTPEFEIDVEGTQRLVEHVIAGGIFGLNVMGSTGEVASLSERKRRVLVSTVVEANRGRVPVITALAQNNDEDALREIESLASQGVRGVLVTPPSYYPTTTPGVDSYYRSLAEKAVLPILIYNIPQFTKIAVPPQTVAALARDGVVAGIKDSSRDFEYFTQLMYATRGIPGFRVFTGSDTMLLASLMLGADGTIAGGPNLEPRFAVELYRAYMAKDFRRAAELQQKVVEMVLATRKGVFPAGIKAGLRMMGICGDTTAPPIPSLPPEEAQSLAAVMRSLGILAQGETARVG